MDRSREANLKDLENKMKYHFKEKALLNTALTHSSYANEAKLVVECSERMEFLGDTVLSLIVSEYLYKSYPEYPEGSLTKVRASVVSELALADVARRLDLGSYLLLGKGEDASGGRERNSVLADAVESVIAGIYLDSDLSSAREFVMSTLGSVISQVVEGKRFKDYKTDLQEFLQKESTESIEYQIVQEIGPDHDKVFVAQVLHGLKAIGTGTGKSKKEAEQKAAEKALEGLLE